MFVQNVDYTLFLCRKISLFLNEKYRSSKYEEGVKKYVDTKKGKVYYKHMNNYSYVKMKKYFNIVYKKEAISWKRSMRRCAIISMYIRR